VKLALDWIKEEGWSNVVIETDAKSLVDMINLRRFPLEYWGLIGQNCLEKINQSLGVSISWVRRTGNWAAHATAKWAEVEPNKIWSCNFPPPIFTHIQKD
jgi:ribonuclease HI